METPRGQKISECSGSFQEFLKDSIDLSNCNNPDMVPLFPNNTWSHSMGDNSVDRIGGILEGKPDRNTNAAGPPSSTEVKLTIGTSIKSVSTNGAGGMITLEEDRQGGTAECSDSHGDFIDRFGVRWVGDCRIFELMAPKQGLTGVHRHTSTNSGSGIVNPFGYDSEMVGPCSPGFNRFEEKDPKRFGGHNKILCDDGDFNTRDVQVDSLLKSNLGRVKNSCINCQKRNGTSSCVPCSCIVKDIADATGSSHSSIPNEFSRLSGRTGWAAGESSPLWSSNRSTCNSFWGVDDPLDDETACSEEGDRIMLYKDLMEETEDAMPDTTIRDMFNPTGTPHKNPIEEFGNLGQISAFSSNLIEPARSGGSSTFPLTIEKSRTINKEAVKKPGVSTRKGQQNSVLDRHGIQWLGDCTILMNGNESSPGTVSRHEDEKCSVLASTEAAQGLFQDKSASKDDGMAQSKIMDMSVLHNVRKAQIDEFPKGILEQTVQQVHTGCIERRNPPNQDAKVELKQANSCVVAVGVEDCIEELHTKPIEIWNPSMDGYEVEVLCDSQILEYEKVSVLYNSISDNFHCTNAYLFSPVMYFLHHLGDCSTRVLKSANCWLWSKAVPKSLTNVSTMCWGIKSRLPWKFNT